MISERKSASRSKRALLLAALGLICLSSMGTVSGTTVQSQEQVSNPQKTEEKVEPPKEEVPEVPIEEISSIEEAQVDERTLLAYDENYIIQVSSHNHKPYFDMVSKQGNATAVILLYAPWCAFSKEFLPEYIKLAGHLYKFGQLTESIFFAKVDGDLELELAKEYGIDGYPSIFFEQ